MNGINSNYKPYPDPNYVWKYETDNNGISTIYIQNKYYWKLMTEGLPNVKKNQIIAMIIIVLLSWRDIIAPIYGRVGEENAKSLVIACLHAIGIISRKAEIIIV